MSENRPSRRHFLRVLGCGLGASGLSAAGCFAAGGGGPVSAGNVKDIAANTLTALPGEGVAIGRDAGGLYAVSLICTHRGCDISSRGDVRFSGIMCFCHGATFDRNGVATNGTGLAPLEHYAVAVDATGAITIDTSTTVDATVRKAV